jgi:hypothetical protein
VWSAAKWRPTMGDMINMRFGPVSSLCAASALRCVGQEIDLKLLIVAVVSKFKFKLQPEDTFLTVNFEATCATCEI